MARRGGFVLAQDALRGPAIATAVIAPTRAQPAPRYARPYWAVAQQPLAARGPAGFRCERKLHKLRDPHSVRTVSVP